MNWREAKTSLRAILLLTLVLGLVYPLVITAFAQVVTPGRADGDIVKVDGKSVGSKLIGQDFAGDAKYFQSRPSISGYSSSSTYLPNYGPNSKTLRNHLAFLQKKYLLREKPFNPSLTAATVPVDGVTDSASGVDPSISVENARIQAGRVAAARGMTRAQVDAVVKANTHSALPLIFDEDAVNVLNLNLALDRMEATR